MMTTVRIPHILDFDNNIKYNYFDLILGGGGFKSYYHIGLFKLLKTLEIESKIKIRYLIGTSAGALSAVSYICNIDFEIWLESYNVIRDKYNNQNDLFCCIKDVFLNYLPENAHELCNGKVKILLSRLTCFGFKPELVEYFDSLDHLKQVILATINIPILTCNNFYGVKINKNLYYDGFFTKMTPIIVNNDLPQLVVYTYKIFYPRKAILKPIDSFIDLLTIRGYKDTINFFKFNEHKILKWVDVDNKKKDTIKKGKFLKFIIPLLFFIYSTINTGDLQGTVGSPYLMV